MRIPLARDEIEFIDDGKKVHLGHDEVDKSDPEDVDTTGRPTPARRRRAQGTAGATAAGRQMRPTTAVQGTN